MHVRHPSDKRKICRLCLQDPDTMSPAKLYIRKELVRIETSIDNFHTIIYIPEIQNIVFQFPHV